MTDAEANAVWLDQLREAGRDPKMVAAIGYVLNLKWLHEGTPEADDARPVFDGSFRFTDRRNVFVEVDSRSDSARVWAGSSVAKTSPEKLVSMSVQLLMHVGEQREREGVR